MNIAISASGPSLDAQVNPRFGRCEQFIILDPETMQFKVLANTGQSAGGGAGIATAQYIVKEGIGAVLTGNCGPNAHQVLSAAGVKVITGVSGNIREAVELYKSGNYSSSDQANVGDHFGMSKGSNR
ncbi:MAG: NifB/NifX family molybdenum-iron cluster-binding protein [Dehalococcoidaceae bacterium]|nr:NifB/NifX family molybdenum-iron cluster-binding protein [Dehalococcoidaceae bacterium]